MKDILWVSHVVPYPPKGGLLQRSFNLIKEVSKYHNVTLIAFNQLDLCSSNEEIEEAKSVLSEFCVVENILKIESDYSFYKKIMLITKGLFPGNTYTVEWLASQEFRRAILESVAKYNPDILHLDTISLYQHSEDIVDLKKVLNHHNVESDMMIRRSEKEHNLLKKMYFYQEGRKLRRYEREACAKVDLNIACSELDIARLETSTGVTNSVAIPNGVDLNYFFPLCAPVKSASLVFAGSLSWYPNLDAIEFFFDEVWEDLVKRIPKVTITVVGANPPAWLLNLSSTDERVVVTGFVDDVRPYIAESEVYICPIRDGGGTKLKVLDALAMGKLLIADPIACEGIDVTDGKNVIFSKSPGDYINSIEYAFSNPARAREMADSGRELVERLYNFERIGEKLGRLYEVL